MGLDQYLTARLRMGKYSHSAYQDKEEQVRKIFPEIYKSGNLDSLAVEFEAGYWRKANQIHKWFVDNCQDGQDDCRDYYVSRDDLRTLLEACREVLKSIARKNAYKKITELSFDNVPTNDGIVLKQGVQIIIDESKAKEILPTTTGFFFGSQDYDEWYIEDIRNTIEIINKCLELPKEWSFTYCSSW